MAKANPSHRWTLQHVTSARNKPARNTGPCSAPPVSWNIAVPLLGTPIVLRQLAATLGLSFVFVATLLALIFIFEGNWEGLLATLTVVGQIYLGLTVLMLLTVVLFFGNRIGMRFTLDARGATSAITESRAEKAARLALLLGLLSGNLAVAGAGALARQGGHNFVAWHRIQQAEFDDRHRTIYLRDSWHTLAALFCPPEVYAEAKAWVTSQCPAA